MQQWERWYSQAPVGGRYCTNKKKGSFSTGRKKTPTYRTAHPPTTDDAVHPPPTHRPNLYYVQQNSSAAVRTLERQCSSSTYSTAVQPCSSTYSSLHLVRGWAGFAIVRSSEKRSRCRFCAWRAATARRCCDCSWCCLLCLPLTQAHLWSRVHGSAHGSSGHKAIRKFNIIGVQKKN